MEEEQKVELTKGGKPKKIRKSTINRAIHQAAYRGQYTLEAMKWFEEHIDADFATEERRVHMKLAIRGLRMAATAISRFLATFS